MFNTYHLKDDEAGGNKIGMRNVLGANFVEKRTSSCLYHFDQSVVRHKKMVRKENKDSYSSLCHDLKNASTEAEYGRRKTLVELLIKRQDVINQPSLTSALNFWDKAKYRWAFAFRSTTHNIPMSSLAEAARASMKSAGEKNLSLVGALLTSQILPASKRGVKIVKTVKDAQEPDPVDTIYL